MNYPQSTQQKVSVTEFLATLPTTAPPVGETSYPTSCRTGYEHRLETEVRAYGANSTSYILLEGHKQYFRSPRVPGFLAYEVRAGVYVIGGDPVCDVENAQMLLEDFLAFVGQHQVCAYQVMPQMLEAFRAAGFDDVQIGAEAIFDLSRFSLKGGAMEIVRAAVNKAVREGLRVSEHHPFAAGTEETNNEISAVSAEWLSGKNSHELGFLLGGLSLDQPSAKRFFVARSGNGAGRIEGFIVCAPIYGRNGYYLDVTRRRTDAVRGTMELLTAEIFKQLAGEGCAIASMGLAPLADLEDPDLCRHPRLTRLMRFAYEQVENTYDFKSLYRYKAKYHPQWERRYLCFRPRVTPRMLYATLRVRDELSLTDLIVQRGRKAWAQHESGRKSMGEKISETAKSWKHAANIVIGLCSALLLS